MEVKEAYENIERIITYGFLSVRISINGHDLLIKNITDKEYQQMLMLCSEKDRLKTNLFSLAYCTAHIDGLNLLENRDIYLWDVIDFYRQSPAIFVIRVIEALNELNQTYIESLDYLEGFSYSNRSRYLWSVMDPYNRSTFVGMKGLDAIGLNSVIENWVRINKQLDEDQEYSSKLSMTLLIVGASNYKSAKMLSKNHETHSQELKELRDEICKYGFDRKRVEQNDKKRDEWVAPLVSKEDLVRELYRQMTGQKDKHDLYVEQWLEDQKARAEQAKKNVEDRQKAYRDKIEATDLDLLEPSKPISSYELNRILEQKKNNASGNTFMGGKEDAEMKDRVLRKISTKIIRPDIKDFENG